jgi:hypothetical protein
MKPVDQTKFGKPHGNCLTACIASILECTIEELPDLGDAEMRGEHWFKVLNYGLRPMGLGIILVEQPGAPCVPDDCHYIACGPSERGLQHCVVHRYGEMVHDPHPSRVGIKAITDWVFIVKL